MRTILILGPTAGGKTSLSVELARRLPGGGVCLCADSMQVYRGMDIGTAKPTAAERGEIEHSLFDIADPAEDGFTVDTWLTRIEAEIARIRDAGQWPIVVGGTNLYVQSFLYGLFDGPESDPAIRYELDGLTLDELRTRLERVDPASAVRIHRNDRKRATRAVEVHALTGERLSDLQGQWDGTPRDDVFIIGLEYDAATINRRINARVKLMLEAGLVEEVRTLELAGKMGRQARAALGYRQILEHFDGRRTLEEAVEQIKIRTRRFAKQQRTWLRRFKPLRPSIWLEPATMTSEQLVDSAISALLVDQATAGDPPNPNL